ncbi:hypothetical protein [Clostridium sp. DL-VIII]|uniref:hypothetical protein n=1 Tax=Clostridium sp. DL-VIII TaxID=641107 RepID=UPI001641B45E|nr:hypothetical protein [Clostridium sp. DL-VIII]
MKRKFISGLLVLSIIFRVIPNTAITALAATSSGSVTTAGYLGIQGSYNPGDTFEVKETYNGHSDSHHTSIVITINGAVVFDRGDSGSAENVDAIYTVPRITGSGCIYTFNYDDYPDSYLTDSRWQVHPFTINYASAYLNMSSATNSTSQQDVLNNIIIQGGLGGSARITAWNPSLATEISSGSISGTAVISYSDGGTETVNFNLPIAKLVQSVNSAATKIQASLGNFVANNNTTAEDIINAVKTNITNSSITIGFGSNSDAFQIQKATYDIAGLITGKIYVSDGSSSTNVPVNITIAKLQLNSADLTDAQNAVAKAESSKLQADVDSAQIAINKLPLCNTKTSLQTRLDVIQEYIDQVSEATKAVEKAEDSKAQLDVDAANELVSTLPDSQDKTNLKERLDVVQAIISARTAVEKAEASKVQSDVDIAKTLVDALSDSQNRTDLESRLDVIKAIINAVTAVEEAEGSKAQSDVDAAKKLVYALPDGEDKAGLEGRLDVVQEIINALTAVEKAESSKTQSDVDVAKALVDLLTDSQEKTDLKDRLDSVQAIIDAAQAVDKAGQTKSQDDADSAQQDINKLPDGQDKSNLQDELNKIENEINQELQDTQASIEAALGNIKATNNTTEQNIIDAVKTNITNSNISMAFGTGEGQAFTKKDADYSNTGAITGTIIVSNGAKSVNVEVNLVIDKLVKQSTGGSSSGGTSSHSSTDDEVNTQNQSNTTTSDTKNESNGLRNINGIWHYYDANGKMITGWIEINALWYYFKSDGSLATGWLLWNNNWYYLNESGGKTLGAMQTGWIQWNGKYYYLNPNENGSQGAMEIGWLKWNNNWYYLNSDGSMKIGWLNYNGVWYYLGSNGVMAIGWFEDADGTWYYLQISGVMAHDITIDGYYLDSTGAWVQ